MMGNKINQIAAGSQVFLQAITDNRRSLDNYPVTIILKVRDSEGITEYLTLQQLKVSPGRQTFAVGSSCALENMGDYEIRAFSFAFTARRGLAPVISHKISAY